MAPVIQLCRELQQCPEIPQSTEIPVRHFAGPGDILPWLDLRHHTFARQRIGVRQWSAEDFCNEFVSRWWWRSEFMWIAEATMPIQPETKDPQSRTQIVGSVTLAMRGEPESAKPVVHWLMVLPRWRRRGIARLLMAHLESAAWNAGHRAIYLETHTAWEAAAKFYEASGYHASAE